MHVFLSFVLANLCLFVRSYILNGFKSPLFGIVQSIRLQKCNEREREIRLAGKKFGHPARNETNSKKGKEKLIKMNQKPLNNEKNQPKTWGIEK